MINQLRGYETVSLKLNLIDITSSTRITLDKLAQHYSSVAGEATVGKLKTKAWLDITCIYPLFLHID